MIAPLGGTLARLRARRGRTLVAAAGVAAAGMVLGTGVTVSYSLETGFDRAAERADLADVTARFDRERLDEVDRRVRSLPNVESSAYRLEFTNVTLAARGRSTEHGVVHYVIGGRRGYAVVAGRDLSGQPDEVVIERGLADEWGLRVGGELLLGSAGVKRVVGIAVSPDNVAFPLASAARVYYADADELRRAGAGLPANLLLLWTRDDTRLDVTLAQARAQSFGLKDLRFVTREGVRVLVGQAAGIVVALLVAFSLVTLAAATIMLAAAAHAEVQRRIPTIGVLRALGFSRAAIAAQSAADAVVIAAVAGALGIAVGAALAAGPSGRLLARLNGLAPGEAIAGLLGLCLVGVVLVVALATAWPAWRAASRRPAELMRAGELRGARPPRWVRSAWGAGFAGLGVRLVISRAKRTVATMAVLAVSAGVVLLMLALASLLERLQTDPGALGKRYQLTAALPASRAGEVAALPGVTHAAPRYEAEAADSFDLGQGFRLIAYPGDHTPFEAPPLAEGRRLASAGECEIGAGLAQALGLHPGATLAAQLASGAEVRFRVVGVVRALENEGRIAYVRPQRLLAADSRLTPTIAVRLAPGASPPAIARRLDRRGGKPRRAGAATTSNAGFLGVLATLLRTVGVLNGLVCLYTLVQVLALTAQERRSTVAVLRASGAGRGHVALTFAGAAVGVAALAAPLGVALERFVLGPAVGRLAGDYVSLPLAAGAAELAGVVVGLLAVALLSAVLVARRLEREPIVAGLRGE